MDTINRMFAEIYLATLEIRVHLFGCARSDAHIWADIGIKAWKSKSSGNFNVRSSEEGSSSR